MGRNPFEDMASLVVILFLVCMVLLLALFLTPMVLLALAIWLVYRLVRESPTLRRVAGPARNPRRSTATRAKARWH